MSKTYDILIIGGGHNGLTAAIVLAKKNKRVLVLEKRPVVGGLAAGEEFHPGYFTNGLLHDTSEVNLQVLRKLQLENFGLKWQSAAPTVALLSKQGECVKLSHDAEQTATEIARFSAKDAQAYREYISFLASIRPFIANLLTDFPPDLTAFGRRQLWTLLKKSLALRLLGKKKMLELLKVTPMCVADFLNEKFETGFIKAGIAAPALYGSFTGPWSSYTTLNLLMHECRSASNIVGGPQALINALTKAAENAGVEIRTNNAVQEILLDENHSVNGVRLSTDEVIQAPIVAASCTPQTTFFNLIQPAQLNYTLEHAVQHYRSRGTTAKLHLALNKPVAFNGVGGLEFYRTGNSFDEMERAFDPVKYGAFSEEPVLDIHVPTVSNTGLAPSGHSVLSVLIHFAPINLKGGWNEDSKKRLYDITIKTLEHYSPGISASIAGAELLTPADLEQRYGLTYGHIYHGEHAVDQLITRPFPACANYTTPFKGLYLCGSGSFPGGGITCMPGYLGAQTILKHC
ncbi:MAG: NAD(P)/FAD-dependent oxidoreductase [Cyclobacteriaceae bacterium]|nr:NAD(P)/FAD-dependent oxidoreductase [Cyclobacteriaceae bacterium]